MVWSSQFTIVNTLGELGEYVPLSILILERCDLSLGLLIISIWTSSNRFIAVVIHQFAMFLAECSQS